MSSVLWGAHEAFLGADVPPWRVALSWALGAISVLPAAALLAGTIRPKTCRLRSLARAVARSRWGAPLAAAVAALLLSVAVAAKAPPAPFIHDEFATLLQADTFAHGRLANPPPAGWPHFETLHVLLQPTYAAKYPPGPALVLALGQVLLGAPIAGVWIVFAAACAAVAWAARAWLGPRWGLAAGLLAALHPAFHFFRPFPWTQSFWGGGLAFLGGALVLGAWRRIERRPAAGPGLALGAGVAALVVTRPWEGLVTLLPVAAALAARALDGPGVRAVLLRRVLPAAAALPAVALAGTMAVNAAVTGSPLTLPYVLYEREYAAAPIFVFQDAPAARWSEHAPITAYHAGWSRAVWAKQRTVRGFVSEAGSKLSRLGQFFAAPYAALLAGAVLLARSRRAGRLALVAGFGVLATLATCWSLPHYVAPAAAAWFLLAAAAARRLACTLANRRAALWLAAAGLLVPPALDLAALGPAFRPRPAWAEDRERLKRGLEAVPGDHIVLVRYAPQHNVNREWVYNGADFAGQRVLWARSMGPKRDAALRAVYPGRQAWVLDADRAVPVLTRAP